MTTKRAFGMIVVVLALALVSLGGAATTLGYINQSQVQVKLSGPSGVVKCNRSAKISATVVGTQDGKPVRNQVVRWSLAKAQSSGDRLSTSSSTTNRSGKTSVTISFGPVAGSRTVRANATVTSPTISVRCAGGLPKTSIIPPLDHVESPASILLRPPTIPDAQPFGGDLPVASLRMTRLGIDLPVIEGDGVSVPEGVVSHYPGTSWPGEGSNAFFYAHAREGNFLELWRVRTGDLVELDMRDGSIAEYRVSRILPVVEWDALEHLAPTPTEQVTLQTSLWYDDTAPRFVVIAERVSGA